MRNTHVAKTFGSWRKREGRVEKVMKSLNIANVTILVVWLGISASRTASRPYTSRLRIACEHVVETPLGRRAVAIHVGYAWLEPHKPNESASGSPLSSQWIFSEMT